MAKSISVLIIGKITPPIGGLTIHAERLMEYLEAKGLSFKFYNNNNFKLSTFYKELSKSRIAHLHSCNVYLQLLFVVICRWTHTKSILTVHANIKSYSTVGNLVERCVLKLCDVPVLLNNGSFIHVKQINNKARMFSSFIPPIKVQSLDPLTEENIRKIKENTKQLFCTNSFDLVFDNKGNEIYGIKILIDIFSRHPTLGLIVSDPSGNYYKHFLASGIDMSSNILLINYKHSFYPILQHCDYFIRNTSTDGDSISIKEALFLQKKVLASDCVERPGEVILYKWKDNDELEEKIVNITNYPSSPGDKIENGAEQLSDLYQEL